MPSLRAALALQTTLHWRARIVRVSSRIRVRIPARAPTTALSEIIRNYFGYQKPGKRCRYYVINEEGLPAARKKVTSMSLQRDTPTGIPRRSSSCTESCQTTPKCFDYALSPALIVRFREFLISVRWSSNGISMPEQRARCNECIFHARPFRTRGISRERGTRMPRSLRDRVHYHFAISQSRNGKYTKRKLENRSFNASVKNIFLKSFIIHPSKRVHRSVPRKIQFFGFRAVFRSRWPCPITAVRNRKSYALTEYRTAHKLFDFRPTRAPESCYPRPLSL